MKNDPIVVDPHYLSNVKRVSLTVSFLLQSALKNVLCSAVFILAFAATSDLRAQTCDPIPVSGGESISAQITINGTGIPVTDGMTIPAWTPLRVDSIATATGACIERAWTNHTQVSVEITSE